MGVLAVARTREDREVPEVSAHGARRHERLLDILDRKHEENHPVGIRGAQQFDAAPVSVVDLVAEAAHERLHAH